LKEGGGVASHIGNWSTVRAGVKGREATAEGRLPLTPERTVGTDQVLAGSWVSTTGRF